MSITFEEAISTILNKVKMSDADHEAFLEDAQILADVVQRVFIESNSIFSEMFNELKTVAIYKKEKVLDSAINFNEYLIFQISSPIEIVFDASDWQCVRLKTYNCYAFVKDGFISGDELESILITELENAIDKIDSVICTNGKVFKMLYTSIPVNPSCVLHTIVAEEIVENGTPSTITFQFRVAFKFPWEPKSLPRGVQVPNLNNMVPSYWYAIPMSGDTWHPKFEFRHLANLNTKEMIRDINSLSFLIFEKFIYMFPNANLFFQQGLTLVCICNAEIPLGGVLIKIVEEIVRSINLVSYYSNSNMLEKESVIKIGQILHKLKFYKMQDCVKMNDFIEIFGLSS